MHQRFPFFQKAGSALLSSEDFRHGLTAMFAVLREYLPVEALSFDLFVEEERALLVHYVVTEQGFFALDALLHLSPAAKEHVRANELFLTSRLYQSFAACEHGLLHAHATLLAEHVPFKDRGYLVGFLRTGERMIGHLACLGSGVNCFAKEHVQLLETILPPCAHAMQQMLDTQMQSKQDEPSEWGESGEQDDPNERGEPGGQDEKDKEREFRTFGEFSEQHAHASGTLHDRQKTIKAHATPDIVGSNGGLRSVIEDMLRLSGKDIPVLILGETGTGKELVANAIQENSVRKGRPFIKVNCGALPDTLLDSELFGHEKGAFTGASYRHQGRFEQADGGTLFLDEVGELSLQAQIRLLRVLQDGIIVRIGGMRPITVDVRIIAATNRNLWQMCAQKTFREDLFHRLNVFPLNLPPLRQRLEDIPVLIQSFAERTAKRLDVPVPPIALAGLGKALHYSWPGNVRELQNLVERAFILSPEKSLDIAPLIPQTCEPAPSASANTHSMWAMAENVPLSQELLDAYIENKVRDLLRTPRLIPEHPLPAVTINREAQIRRALEMCNGKVYGPGGAAELLGVNHNTLRSRMRKLGISHDFSVKTIAS